MLSSIPAMIARPSADITSREVKTSLLSKKGFTITILPFELVEWLNGKERREKTGENRGKEVNRFTNRFIGRNMCCVSASIMDCFPSKER